MEEEFLVSYKMVDLLVEEVPELASARLMADIISNHLLTYLICTIDASWVQLINEIANHFPSTSFKQDLSNDACGTIYVQGRKIATFMVMEYFPLRNTEITIKCMMIIIDFDFANCEVEDVNNMDYIGDCMKKPFGSLFFSAEAEPAFGSDGKTRIGFKISQSICGDILTASWVPFSMDTYPEINW